MKMEKLLFIMIFVLTILSLLAGYWSIKIIWCWVAFIAGVIFDKCTPKD